MRLDALLDDSPSARRRLALVLYAVVGPVFFAVLWLLRAPASPQWPVLTVAGLIIGGALALLLQRQPTARHWIFPVSVAPTVCCGLAYYAGGPLGAAYLGVVGAPLAWAAVLFEGPVVVTAYATGLVTCFLALLAREGPLGATLGTLLWATIGGLVGLVVFGMARHLRETQATLGATLARDQAVLAALPDTLAVADREGRFLAVHSQPDDDLPLSPAQLPGRTVYEFLPPEVSGRMRQAIDRTFASGEVQVLEYAAPYRQGLRCFEAHLARSADDQLVMLRRDVTETRLTEQALLAALARSELLARVPEENPGLCIQLDAERRVAYANPAARELLHREVSVGAPAPSILEDEARRAQEGGEVRHAECTYRGLTFAVTFKPVGQELIVYGRDVTDLKEVERRLRSSELRVRLALAAGEHFDWELDVETGALVHGPGWAEYMGLPQEALPATLEAWWLCVHPDDVSVPARALEDCIAGRVEEYTGQYRVQRSDGSWRFLRSQGRATARGPDGRALRMVGTRTDITETEALHQRLVAATRLASVGTLAAGVAHEINNPLAWMESSLLACQELVAGLEASGAGLQRQVAELRDLLGDSLTGSRRIGAIVKAMRTLGRRDVAGELQRLDVREELLGAIQMARNHLTQRASLRIDVPPSLPAVRARTSELGRVFLNLLMNAVQAIPEGASDQNAIAISARAEHGEVMVEVVDSGHGLTPEVRARLFEPFFTTKPVGEGTGLGLAMARSIVDAAGGRIEVESLAGQGATFRVRLPAAPPEAEPLPAAAGAHPVAAQRRRVLVIDDEPLVQRALQRMLARRHDVTLVSEAREALVRLEGGERWDAILCDLMMSGMDGIGFHQALAERVPAQLSRLAFVTGGAFGERATRFLEEHPVVVVPKPVDGPVLLEVIERLAGAPAP